MSITRDKFTNGQKNTLKELEKQKNIILTGKPGTGKTEFLRVISAMMSVDGKKVIETGSTGMAASNLDHGHTIHSILHWHPLKERYDYDYCSSSIDGADLLIIDEVSMLNTAIINHLFECLEHTVKRPQIIMSGDFFQLPPVKDKLYPFENKHWGDFGLTPCVLTDVVRQADPEYKAMLEKAMLADSTCLGYFNTKTSKNYIDGAICICTKNEFASAINRKFFDLLPGTAKKYDAQGDNIRHANFNTTRIEEHLLLKKGMRVLSLRNDGAERYQNGSLGTVVDMCDDSIRVQFDNGNIADINRFSYEIDNKVENENPVMVWQFPLLGGYAITIHKSQGQTFDAVNIKAPRCWDPGQLYVALSRARSIETMHLMEHITPFSLITDPRVMNYYLSLCGNSVA